MSDRVSPTDLARVLYDQSKKTPVQQDAVLLYQASVTINVLMAKLAQLQNENPDDDLHG